MENKKPTLGNGKVCYIEIPAIDINVSVAFYRAVFGWQIRQRGDGSIAFDDAVGEVSGGREADRYRRAVCRDEGTNRGLLLVAGELVGRSDRVAQASPLRGH